ncbi:MAG: energy transducer TonB [Bacteroidota bacterium]
MIAVALPPLEYAELRPGWRERLAQGSVVLALHALLVYAVLYVSVNNDLIRLPPSISVRLLPLAEEKKIEAPRPAPPKPLPLKPAPPAPRPALQAPPVLAVTNNATAGSFSVAPQPPAPPAPAVVAPSPAPAVVAARFDADYLHNPKPVYPVLSRRNGETGKVLLKVRVSAQGSALDVAVSKSSGYPRLDTAAIEAVLQWRFVSARRGDEPLESSVIVPITFALE